MKVNLSTRPPAPKEDPYLEKLTNSVVIAFFAAAAIKIGMYVYQAYFSSEGGPEGTHYD